VAEPGSVRAGAPVLELRDLTLAFGGLNVLDHLALTAGKNEIVSIIGPNGAGKTTVFNLVSGIYVPAEGDILLDGRSVAGLSPHQINRRGIARTFQTLRLFLNMTVEENVMAATYGHTSARMWQSALRTPKARREEREVRELAHEMLGFFGQRLVGYRWKQPVYSLSYANRRRVEIARAMATNPRVLLLDEPAAGMNPNGDARDHRAHRAPARRAGLHDRRHRARHARRRGHLGPGGRARPRREDRRGVVRRRWRPTGRRRGVPRPGRGSAEVGEPVLLRLRQITTYYGQMRILDDVSIEVGEGELVCLLGGNASGKSTTLKTTLGLVRPREASSSSTART
jgi:ABC-type branched-subunit amino acid transport system ATPase component